MHVAPSRDRIPDASRGRFTARRDEDERAYEEPRGDYFDTRLSQASGIAARGQAIRLPTASVHTHLESELQRASVVPPEQVPPYVVTMNTQVRMIDADTGKERMYTLVFPSDANLEEGKLSILSDLGVAILGYSVGDTIEWEFPEGLKRIRIDMIGFQPEATKQYEL